ncbi:MAG: hypothetical protein ACYCTV_11235 [Leptospirales bacterium]
MSEQETRNEIFVPVGERLSGSSFVAVQRREHDLDVLNSCPGDERNNMIGQKQKTNEGLDQSPLSSRAKRSSQERFHPTSPCCAGPRHGPLSGRRARN